MASRLSHQQPAVRIYSSLSVENAAEHARRASLTPLERWREFAVLQRRIWGAKWTSESMVKTASYEVVDW